MNALSLTPNTKAKHLRRAIANRLDATLVSNPDGKYISVTSMDALVERLAQTAENIAAIPDGPDYQANAIAAGKAYLAKLLKKL